MTTNPPFFDGILQLEKIDTIFPGGQSPIPPNWQLELSATRCVHYNDCQQLIIWLPQPGSLYTNLDITRQPSNQPFIDAPVSGWLNGSIQLVFDTRPWPPGNYSIIIHGPNQLFHQLSLQKFPEGVMPPTNVPPHNNQETATDTVATSDRKIYRDGFGTIIEDEDLRLRDRLLNELTKKFGRTISFEGNLRAGKIIYQDLKHRAVFENEMGGGDCLAIIYIPAPQHWEAQTAIPLRERDDVVEYIALTVQQRQAPNTRYEIGDDTICFFSL